MSTWESFRSGKRNNRAEPRNPLCTIGAAADNVFLSGKQPVNRRKTAGPDSWG